MERLGFTLHEAHNKTCLVGGRYCMTDLATASPSLVAILGKMKGERGAATGSMTSGGGAGQLGSTTTMC